MVQPSSIIAVGEKAAIQMEELGVPYKKVRHPANGGAKLFRQQISEILNLRA